MKENSENEDSSSLNTAYIIIISLLVMIMIPLIHKCYQVIRIWFYSTPIKQSDDENEEIDDDDLII